MCEEAYGSGELYYFCQILAVTVSRDIKSHRQDVVA